MRVNGGQVQSSKLAKSLSAPILPATFVQAQQGLLEIALQAEALAPGFGWCGIQAQRVAAQAISHHQVNVFQGDRMGRGRGILPMNLALANDEFGLREEPISQWAVRAGLQRNSRKAPLAFSEATDLKLRALNVQLVKGELRHRLGRKRGHHPWKPQDFLTCRVAKNDLARFKCWNQAV